MTTRGDRLRSYLFTKTGGKVGWQGDLVEKSGVKRQTISKYTASQYDAYPDLGTLSQLAKGLGVQTFEIVAAMDGDPALNVLDPRVEEALVRLIDRLLDERQVPRR
jgi:transcriptional regulator with XRE-family HTH domain